MNLLMLSLDPGLVDPSSRMGDVRQRHARYAKLLDACEPGSQIYILVRAGHPQRRAQISPQLTTYAVGRSPLPFLLRGWLEAMRIHRRARVDLITVQTPFIDGLLGLWLCSRLRAPLLVQMHLSNPGESSWWKESAGNKLRTVLARWVVRRADAVRVTSESTRRWLAEAWQIPERRIYLLPVTPARLRPVSGVIQAERPTLLFVGRLSPEKGVDLLLHALAVLAQELPELHLLLAGEGPEKVSLQALAERLDVADQVTFAGALAPEELAAYYQRAWLLVLPSRHESFGRVIIEAFSLTRPVVATATEGARALIKPGETGLLVPVDDPEALASALLPLLKDPALARAMGARAHQWVETQSNIEHQTKELIECWLQVRNAYAHLDDDSKG